MPLNSGDLDRRITIERATVTRDSFNNPVQSWLPLTTVWAAIEELSDRERIAAKETGADLSVRFRIRHSRKVADVNAKDRVVYRGETYEIVGVKDLGRREGIEISAVVRVD